MARNNRAYREVDGKMIRGTFLEVLFRSGTHVGVGTLTYSYVSTHISVYEDGMIDCWGLVDLDGFKEKVRQGEIVTSIPEGTRIYLGGGAGIHLTATEVSSTMTAEDLIGQVEDEIRALRGKPTSSDLCVDAYIAYRREPSEAAKARLQMAFEAVPTHLREYLELTLTHLREYPELALTGYIEDDIRVILVLPDY
jgi:hypothetical protein